MAHTKEVTKEIVKQSVSDMQIIQGAITKVAKELLEGTNTKPPTFSDLVNLMRLKLELKGDLPLNDAELTGNKYYNVVVNSFSAEQQKSIDRNLGSIFTRMGKDSSI